MSLSAQQVRSHLRGVAVGLLTPFDDDLEIEHEKLAENAQDLYQKGIRTFLSVANISEYHSLSESERVSVAETSVDALPSDACVLAGVGGSTAAAQDLIRAYDAVDVDALMVMPPDHTYLHEQGLLEYYRDLASVTVTPLVPYVRGFDPSVEYLAALTRVEGVIGIKYALEDPVKLGAGVAAGADDVVWVDGLAEPFAVSFWAEGAEGFSAGVSNFRPEIGLELFEALSDGDWERACQLRNICLPYQNFRSETGQQNTIPGAISVSAVKKGLDLAGLHGGTVREPIRPLAPEEADKAEQLYAQLEDDIESLVQ
ncbi:dihydrodipicolinate synthase family protein [Natrialba asiatica]|uniref:Dihydrodipicolinate synthetase n=1 Tax=Natrialba asiatica (strain ATCC 700177 / DSM 12278 / JCM 9576 / FERM P-10747 / NBRC 102637 / 172P1) TaxID=29540 RepID=M0B573_NATA1|nr:dihydrodipicolinate synthase family protein [Natrialba asiatica]ELZ05413.1 dihydrodipicolinate synthetase [Natrialba asiatica DSM 12278]